MKVLLIRPDFEIGQRRVFERLGNKHLPLNLLYLSAMLEKAGIAVKICDEIVGDNYREIVAGFSPDLVGINMASPLMPKVIKIIEDIKRKNKDIKVVLGGPHPTIDPKGCLEQSMADLVIRGEGEHTLAELCRVEDWSQVKGLAYKKGGRIILNSSRDFIQDLDELPFPARHLLDLDKYKDDDEFGFILSSSQKRTRMLTSRGCPYECTFCARYVVHGRTVRYRSVGNVLAEMELVMKRFGVENFIFIDDCFMENEERIKDFCQAIIDKRWDISWVCQNTAYRTSSLSDQTLCLMQEAGCKMISIGIEYACSRMLKAIKKPGSVEDIFTAFKKIRKAKITPKAYMMVGYPGETREDFEESLRTACKLNPIYLFLSMATSLPGTELYQHASSRGNINIKKTLFFYTEDKVLKKRRQEFLRRYYFRIGYLKNVFTGLSFKKFIYYLKLLKAFLFA